jgi:demethoxyubiquinone hydroxylase (CLK1/Coq7/Cat5 family)
MVYALRSELGATYVYPALARFTRDDELRGVLRVLSGESLDQVERLRRLMAELGGSPPTARLRRRVAAHALALATPLIGMRLALRLCCDAEAAVSRWYAGYAVYFARLGDDESARELDDLSRAKYRHSVLLQTWVDHLPYRRLP